MPKKEEILELIKQANMQMDMIIGDTSVPKNVRNAVSEAKNKLNADGDFTVRASSAIYNLDSVSNDINLPPQARTVIWGVLSILESIKD
ncbi:MAG: UPF0147 family protein [Candidatus Marsarchaeota archaeon]|nr:UPF0147 family protein [Candidatus Marsarchaeota archaeon]MCL5101835.1 UPF0147 family protein [Candidatus Marsarchaeota archaeon]